MPKLTPSLTLSVLALVALIGSFALLLVGRPIPDLITTIDTASLSAVAGAAFPAVRDNTPSNPAATAPAPAAAPTAPVSGPVTLG
jgi:hypothetical protein